MTTLSVQWGGFFFLVPGVSQAERGENTRSVLGQFSKLFYVSCSCLKVKGRKKISDHDVVGWGLAFLHILKPEAVSTAVTSCVCVYAWLYDGACQGLWTM